VQAALERAASGDPNLSALLSRLRAELQQSN
jgi:hypothetical protein